MRREKKNIMLKNRLARQLSPSMGRRPRGMRGARRKMAGITCQAVKNMLKKVLRNDLVSIYLFSWFVSVLH